MACKVYLRRFVALLLCCVLVGSSFAQSALASDPVTAASLAIAGGQLAGAGLSGEAALSLAGPVGAVVGVTLGSLGVNAYVSKAAQEAGKTRTRFVLDKLVLWGAQAGYTQEQLYIKIAQGISVAADGTIQLGKDAAQMIQQFGNWIFAQDGLVVESPTTSNPNSSVIGHYSGLTTVVGSSAVPTRINIQNSDRAYGNLSSNNSNAVGQTIYIVNLASGAVYLCSERIALSIRWYRANDTGIGTTSLSLTDNHGTNYYLNQNRYLIDGLPIYNVTFAEFYNSIAGQNFEQDATVTSDEVFTGTPDAWAENKDVLNPSADDTPVTLNPDLLNPIIDSLADGQQATMSIVDYLEALQDAWDHALDDVHTAIGTITDTLTGIQEQIAIPQEAVKNPTITNPSVTPETTPVLDPSTVDPGTAVTGLSFDLTHIFPFCIPFDIYAMLATLSATPEAPVYHVHYEGPYNIVIDFTVDLSPWDSVASVLRTVELLAFCIGLAYVTRSMFIRS